MLRIISLTDAGLALAERLASLLEAQVMHQPKPFSQCVQQAFNLGDQLIFICATGIVVRTLAPVLNSKKTDPAVLVLDERGEFVIPLLSGHEGGANQLAAQVAQLLDSQLVSTTANAYQQPLYTAGMGCERHCSKADLLLLLEQSVARAGISLQHISALASIDIKNDETGLIELAAQLKIPFLCYSVAQLQEVAAQLQTPSDYVFQTVGVYGVAESAALVSARNQQSGETATSELMLAKQKSKVATCAIGRSYKL
ncbi:cobalamin biosynthesis protein CbiG ['Osedax' symbiont bacterium Rs2_46_30_T18]|nr:cobalamin biosynthesis protein CbiG ['Osedax' symbiont bacterium Rs2_46_30_T18]